MSDIADRAQEDIDVELAAAIRHASKDIPPGVAGECEMCGEWSGRLVGGACAPCRDRHRLQ